MNIAQKLRDWADKSKENYSYATVIASEDLKLDVYIGDNYSLEQKLFYAIADEIEKNHLPLPCYENGQPVSFESPFQTSNGKEATATSFHFTKKGVYINSKGESGIIKPGEFVKEPYPVVFDMNGIQIKSGDKGFDLHHGCQVEVVNLFGDPILKLRVKRIGDSETYFLNPDELCLDSNVLAAIYIDMKSFETNNPYIQETVDKWCRWLKGLIREE